jgi:hypothetical protein
MSQYLVYFYALFSLVLFRFEFILLQYYFLFESFYFNCIFYISGMNIGWKESWSKRKESGADLEQEYEDSRTKI